MTRTRRAAPNVGEECRGVPEPPPLFARCLCHHPGQTGAGVFLPGKTSTSEVSG
jgi:hypothetical protein